MAAFVRAGDDHVFHEVLHFQEVAPGDESVVGGFLLRFGRAVHPVPAVVTRVAADGSTLVYSGDTGPGGDLIEVSTGAGTLMCEASLQGPRDEHTYPYHLTARETGEIAAMAGVYDLVVTHVPARLDPRLSIDQAASAFAGSISYASPGATFEIPRTE
jgi:ribonuclease BN (tRNA processing enzyme)